MLDLISHVHLKLTIPLESRLRDVQAATYYTLFSRKYSAIVTEMATVDGQQPHEMLAWVKASRHLPLFGRPGEEPRSRIIFATDGPISDKWKKQEASHTGPRRR